MTFNISSQIEQSQRERDDLVAVEERRNKETDLFNHGQFDGATGGKPEREMWREIPYRSGYLIGVGEFYDRTYKTVRDKDPF